MRNRIFMHTSQDDCIMGTMRFVSKDEDTQVYGALIPTVMTTPKIRDSPGYHTYLAFATRAATPKTKRIYNKPVSPMTKTTTTSPEETHSKNKHQQLLIQALFEEAQLKKVLKRSKQETNIHQAGALREGADLESKVLDEPKGKSSDTSEETGLKPEVLDVSKADSSKSEYKTWGDSGDEANEQGDDEDVIESDDDHEHADDDRIESDNARTKEYEKNDRELYGDVNVRLTDAEPDDEDKDDKEMTNAKIVDAKHENVIQESAATAVPDSETLTALHQRITDLEKDVKKLKDIDNSIKRNFTDIVMKHSVLAKIMKRLKQQYAPQKSIEHIQEIKMQHTRKQQVPKETITSSDTATLKEFDQKTTLFQAMTSSKSFNRCLKQRALYHALIELIFKDEDVMENDVADKLKKRKPHNADKDEGPFAGSDRGSDPSPDPEWNKSKSIDNGPKQSWLNDMDKATKPPLTFDDLTHTPIEFSAFNNLEGHHCPYDLTKLLPVQMSSQGRQIIPANFFFNNDLEYLRGGSNDKKYTASTTKSKATRYELKGIKDMVPNLWSPVKVVYDRYALLGNYHWQSTHQNFYGYTTKIVSKHDVYLTKRILSIISVKVNEWYGCVSLDLNDANMNNLQLKFDNFQKNQQDFQKKLEQKQDDFQNQMMNFIQILYNNKLSSSSSLPSNTIPNLKGEGKAITTRSGMSYKEPPILPPGVEQQEPIEETTYTEFPSTKDIQPPLVQVEAQVDKPIEEPSVV
nr:hypothetical protein [Tanacetum cinerariifolium]